MCAFCVCCLYNVTDIVILVEGFVSCRVFFGYRSTHFIIRCLRFVSFLVDYLCNSVLVVVFVFDTVTVRKLDLSILHISVICILGFVTVSIGRRFLLVVSVILIRYTLVVGVCYLCHITHKVVFIFGLSALFIFLDGHLSD